MTINAAAQTNLGLGFDTFKTETGQIDLIIIGNGVHQLINDPGVSDPSSFYNRANTSGNNFQSFIYLDNDSNPTTFNSSSASYTLPAGHELVSVTLHVGGFDAINTETRTFDPDDFTAAGMTNGPLPVATYNSRDVRLSFDGGTTYNNITADAYRKTIDYFTSSYDITQQAVSGISGNQLDITVADIVLRGPFVDDSGSVFGGWTAQIVTRDPSLTTVRTAVIYEGLLISVSNAVDLNIDGFLTPVAPTSGPLMTFMAGDGDLAATDTASFGPNLGSLTPFQDALHAANDIANTRGTYKAQYFTDLTGFTRSPVRDRDVIDIIGIQTPAPILPPGSTEAVFQFETTGGKGISYHSIGVMFEVDPLDWGDAPDTYLTSGPIGSANEGAAHALPTNIPVGDSVLLGSSIYLGTNAPDPDPSGQPSVDGLGDDDNGSTPDDEDGVTIPTLTPNAGSTFAIELMASQTGFLNAWLDWNQNGQFDSTEMISSNDQIIAAGLNTLNITVPTGVNVGNTFARFRVCGSTNDCNSPGGLAADGEVEDYQVVIQAANIDLEVNKDLITSGPFTIGQNVQYIITVTNNGPDTATNINISDVPTNLSFASVSSTNCSAFPCVIPSLTAGSNEMISVDATINTSGAFDNEVTVSVDENDIDTSNNTDNSGNGGVVAVIPSVVQPVPSLNLWAILLLISTFLFIMKRKTI